MTRRRTLAFVAACALALGCAARQPVALGGCVTEEVKVYVDGRLLEQNPDVLELRADQPHKLYFKRPGHEPQLVVLEPRQDADGRPVLSPADVCAVLVPIKLDRELTIEAEDDEGP